MENSELKLVKMTLFLIEELVNVINNVSKKFYLCNVKIDKNESKFNNYCCQRFCDLAVYYYIVIVAKITRV